MPENAPLIIIIIFRKHDMWNDFFFLKEENDSNKVENDKWKKMKKKTKTPIEKKTYYGIFIA